MSSAEQRAPTLGESWAQICEQHPDEWLFLADVEREPGGAIKSARIIAHHLSMKELLKQPEWSDYPALTYAHTRGLTLRPPRIVMTDEIRDAIRPRR